MKHSEKILKGNNIPEDLPKWKQEIIKNTVLLEHIINNDMRHLWRWLLVMLILIAGLYGKTFIGG